MFQCVNHPERGATWHCHGCHASYCDDCVVIKRYGTKDIETCKSCTDMLSTLVAQTEEVPGLWTAFGWPFHGNGPAMPGAGTLCFTLFGLIPGAGLLFWPLMLGYGMRIVQEAGRGEHDPPDWPELADIGDIVWPACLALGVAVMSLGPALWLLTEGASGGVVLLALALGSVYAPMAWIAAAVSGRLLAITPIGVLPMLLRVRAIYWGGCAMLLLSLYCIGFVAGAVREALPGPLALPANYFADIYLLMVQMRIIGIIFCRHRYDLGFD